MKKIIFGLVCFTLTALCAAQSVSLEKMERYTVIIPEKATKQEKYAAKVLADYLGRLCHVKIPVAIENKKKPGPFVSIGETRQAEENNFSGALKPQGYSLDVKGKNLFIRGGSPGPLNGVISFLEEDLGCRWYAEPYRNIKHHPDPGLTVIPNLSGKKLQVTPRSYTPPFVIREIMYHYGTHANPESVMFFRQSPISYHSYLPNEAGACLNSTLFVHTYRRLLPPSEYFAEHPEYYALQHGKRVKQTVTSGSVCYTHPDVPKIMANNIRKEIRKNSEYRYFAVSANDTSAAGCECSNCAPIIRKLGIPGTQVMLANKVAEYLAADYPDIQITTLVYGSGTLDITNIKAHPNVLLFLAPIGARFNQIKMLIPIQENQIIANSIQNCRRVSDNLIFWDYLDFTGMPFPNFDQVRDTLQYLAAQGVKGYFADCTNNGASLTPLKKWLYAHLVWNPDLNMDALIQEFIQAYYRTAAPEITEYVNIMRKAWQRFKTAYDKANGNGVTLEYTETENHAMRQLFEKAMKKADADEILKGRIAREYIVFLVKELSYNPVVIGIENYQKDYDTAIRLLAYAPANAFYIQQKLPERWARKLAHAKNPQTDSYSPNTVAVRNPLTVSGMSAYLPDPAAIKGKSSRHRGKTPWGIQWKYHTFIDYLIPGKTYIMRLRIRAELKRERKGRIFDLRAFHHGNEKLNSTQGTFTAAFIPEDIKGNYRWVTLGKINFRNPDSTGMFWMNTLVDSDEAIWYDTMELIPIEEYKGTETIPTQIIQL